MTSRASKNQSKYIESKVDHSTLQENQDVLSNQIVFRRRPSLCADAFYKHSSIFLISILSIYFFFNLTNGARVTPHIYIFSIFFFFFTFDASAMKCGIRNCVLSDNRFLWRCYGKCNRQFHAACVGVQRNQEEVLRTFMLPLCHDCQEEFISELDLKKFITPLQHISENIGSTLESNHKLIQYFKSISATHDDALANIEESLNELKKSVSLSVSTSKHNTTEIKQALTSLCNTPATDIVETMESTAKFAATAAVAEFEATKKQANSINDILPQFICDLKNEISDSHTSLVREVKSNIEEIKSHIEELSSSTSVANIGSNQNNVSLADELSNAATVVHTETKNDHTSPGWRFLGNKWRWKLDWSEYDAKQKTRRLREKAIEKAKRKRIRSKKQHNTLKHNNTTQNKSNETNEAMAWPSDKELLATAKSKFACPPSTTDHPIAALTVPSTSTAKFINFQKGETINPYRGKNQPTPSIAENVTSNSTASSSNNGTSSPAVPSTEHTRNTDSQFELDPLRPSIVRLTEKSTEGDGRFLKARLRDPSIMKIVRLYLAYMKDQQTTVCVEGMTPTSIKMLLASEGLPTNPDQLQRIFIEVYQEYGLQTSEALADLQSYRNFLSSQRTHRLQQLRESTHNFFRPKNFRK